MSAASPHHPPSTRAAVLLAVLAALAAALGTAVLVRADAGLSVRQVTVGGVPMTEVRAGPPTADARRPGVVIAHGFAGSARLMRPIADTVARRGAVALLFDFAGHGASRARLGPDMSPATLAADLDAAVGHLRAQPDVDPAQIMLVGHSMGAGAVTRYAAGHPEIARTVAISLPDAGELPPGRPAELLLIVGGAEFPAFRRAADDAVGRGASVGRRPAVVVPGVEHISVLFAPRTHEEIADWLPSVDGTAAPRPLVRLAGAALLLLAFAVGVVPLAALLLGRRGTGSPGPGGGPALAGSPGPAGSPALTGGPTPAGARVPLGGAALLGLAVLATGVGAAVAALLPTNRLPLAVGGYVTGFLLVSGLLVIAGQRLLPGRSRTPGTWQTPGTIVDPADGRAPAGAVGAALALTAYAVVAVALPIHLGLTSALPVGARWWLLPLVVAACLLFLLGVELVAAGRTWRRLLVVAVTVLVLSTSAVVGVAPGFVLLVVPLFAVLLGWHVLWAAVLRRYAAPRWLPALVGAALLGWPIATTLPLR
ncbi:dienelactone hydrolase family protein [Micromonospora lupini]|uniref:Putative dienelactone hydrolase n=1 Tax=Micromonospora lupini str. Lupac 08 TaxID=1150864 RepID=I0KXX0_9ACTN|nr:alpha/beta fold hydrolase [Micromonospora lupini]CCH16417.1 Putative dienelactone hydrolase [Micromonospora lupini str. Lupac 08]